MPLLVEPLVGTGIHIVSTSTSKLLPSGRNAKSRSLPRPFIRQTTLLVNSGLYATMVERRELGGHGPRSIQSGLLAISAIGQGQRAMI